MLPRHLPDDDDATSRRAELRVREAAPRLTRLPSPKYRLPRWPREAQRRRVICSERAGLIEKIRYRDAPEVPTDANHHEVSNCATRRGFKSRHVRRAEARKPRSTATAREA